MSRYDDDIWRLVPAEAAAPSPHLVSFVRGLGAPAAALDLGCGDGRLTAELQAGELVAADVSEVALERASTRVPSARTVHLGLDEPLPLEDGTFDLVLCAETLEHVRDVQLMLSEVRRVLRPGGRLAVTTPAHGRCTGVDIALRGFERTFDPLSPHLRFFSARSLVTLLDALGFDAGDVRTERRTLLCVATR
jgi:ubiquinone/menaquinone biosynthesis C-methylase UbiE